MRREWMRDSAEIDEDRKLCALYVIPTGVFEFNQDFSTELDLFRTRKAHSPVEFIYYAAKQYIPIDVVNQQLHVA